MSPAPRLTGRTAEPAIDGAASRSAASRRVAGNSALTSASTAPSTGAATTLMTASGGVVGLLSYACTLAMAHLLAPAEFTAFAAAAGLLSVAGVAAAALIPFPLAEAVRVYPAGSPQRRAAQRHALSVAALVGLGAAVLLGGLALGFATAGAALATAVSAFTLFLVAPVWGHLQGEGRFGRYAVLTVLEVAARLLLSVLAALAGWGAAGPIGGFAAGVVVVLLLAGLAPVRDALPLSALAIADSGRWRETGAVGLVQAALSALAVADVVVLAYVVVDPVAAAGYQAVTTLAKAPVYVAVGTALVGFPAIRAASETQHASPAADLAVAEAVRSYVRLVVPAAGVVATVPPALALLVLPAEYGPALDLLPLLALAGLGVGTTTVLATLLLARRAEGPLVSGLTGALALLAVGLGWGLVGGVPGLARGFAFSALAGAVWVIVMGRRVILPAAARAGRSWRVVGAVLAIVLTVAVLVPTRNHPIAWLGAVLLVGLAVVGLPMLRARVAARTAGPPPAPGFLHVLHLGFEDPAMPGSGGGALRTGEIDSRLAEAGHRVTVLVQRYPGCVDRVDAAGVEWVHIGFGRGTNRLTRLLGYALAVPAHVRATTADLVVEDFFAPVSSIGVPVFSPAPTVAVVQWLNARDKAREYHLPVHWIERLAVPRHRRFVVVSRGVAEQVREFAPDAEVTVVGNGVRLSPATAPRTDDVVFIGRLEIGQKGLDLLLDAWAEVEAQIPGDLVIAGTGPDSEALRARAEGRRVRFVGWVAGEDKARLLASARVAVVPSRFETFGIVAVEALAAGAPVVAYDIDCLREVVPPDLGRLVPLTGDHAADATAFGRALRCAWADDRLVAQAAVRGPQFARRYDWDALAREQEAVYRAAVGRGAPARGEPGVHAGGSP